MPTQREAANAALRLCIHERDVALAPPTAQTGERDCAENLRGEGIDEITRERTLKGFFMTTNPGCGRGRGLGRGYGLKTQSKGTVPIASASGETTTISLFLPRTTKGL